MHALRGRGDHLVGCAWFWVWARGGGNLDARPWFLAGFALAAVGIAGHVAPRLNPPPAGTATAWLAS
jgi:hypothetical protein